MRFCFISGVLVSVAASLESLCDLSVPFSTPPPINPCPNPGARGPNEPQFSLVQLGLACPSLGQNSTTPIVPIWDVQPILIDFNLPVTPFGMHTASVAFGGANTSLPTLPSCLVPISVEGNFIPPMEGVWVSSSQFRLSPTTSWPVDSKFSISIVPNLLASSGQSLDLQSQKQSATFASVPLTPFISGVAVVDGGGVSSMRTRDNFTEVPPASKLEISFDAPIDLPTIQVSNLINIFPCTDFVAFDRPIAISSFNNCTIHSNCVSLGIDLPPSEVFAVLFLDNARPLPSAGFFGSSRDVFVSPDVASLVSPQNVKYWDFGMRISGLRPFVVELPNESQVDSSRLNFTIPHGLKVSSSSPAVRIQPGGCPNDSPATDLPVNVTSSSSMTSSLVLPLTGPMCLTIPGDVLTIDVYGQPLQTSSTTLLPAPAPSPVLLFPDLTAQPFVPLAFPPPNVSLFYRSQNQIGDVLFSVAPVTDDTLFDFLLRSFSFDSTFQVLPSNFTVSPANFSGDLTVVEASLSLEHVGTGSGLVLIEQRTDHSRSASIFFSPAAILAYGALPRSAGDEYIPVQVQLVPISSSPVAEATVELVVVGSSSVSSVARTTLNAGGYGLVRLPTSVCLPNSWPQFVAITRLTTGHTILSKLDSLCDQNLPTLECDDFLLLPSGDRACPNSFAIQIASDRQLYASKSKGSLFGFVDFCLSQSAGGCVPTPIPNNTYVWLVVEFVDVLSTPRGEFRRASAPSTCIHTIATLSPNGAFQVEFEVPADLTNGPIAVSSLLVQNSTESLESFIPSLSQVCDVSNVALKLRSLGQVVSPAPLEIPAMRVASVKPQSLELSLSKVPTTIWSTPVSLVANISTYSGTSLEGRKVSGQMTISLRSEVAAAIEERKLANLTSGTHTVAVTGVTDVNGQATLMFDLPTSLGPLMASLNKTSLSQLVYPGSWSSISVSTPGLAGGLVQLATSNIVVGPSPYYVELGLIAPSDVVPNRPLFVRPEVRSFDYRPLDASPPTSDVGVVLVSGEFNTSIGCEANLPTLNDQLDVDALMARPNATKQCDSFEGCILLPPVAADYMLVAFARLSTSDPTLLYSCRYLNRQTTIRYLDLQLANLTISLDQATNKTNISYLNPFAGIATSESPVSQVVVLWPVVGVSPSLATPSTVGNLTTITISSTPAECIQKKCLLSIYAVLPPAPRALVSSSVLLQADAPLVAFGSSDLIVPKLPVSSVLHLGVTTLQNGTNHVVVNVTATPDSGMCTDSPIGDAIVVVVDKSWLDIAPATVGNSSDLFTGDARSYYDNSRRSFSTIGLSPALISSLSKIEEIIQRRVNLDVWAVSHLGYPLWQGWDTATLAFDLSDEDFMASIACDLTPPSSVLVPNAFTPWVPECIPPPAESIRDKYSRSFYALPRAGSFPSPTNSNPPLVYAVSIPLDSQLSASVEFDVPTSTGSFVVSTFAVVSCGTRQAWGSNSTDVVVSRPFSVVPTFPDVLHLGDTVSIPVSVVRRDLAGGPLTVAARLSSVDEFSLASETPSDQQMIISGSLSPSPAIFNIQPKSLGPLNISISLYLIVAGQPDVLLDQRNSTIPVVPIVVPSTFTSTFVLSSEIARNSSQHLSSTTPAPSSGFLKRENGVSVPTTIVENLQIPLDAAKSNVSISASLGFGDAIRLMTKSLGSILRPLKSDWDLDNIHSLPDDAKPRPDVQTILAFITASNLLSSSYSILDSDVETLGQQATALLPYYIVPEYILNDVGDVPLGLLSAPTWALNLTEVSQRRGRAAMDVSATTFGIIALDLAAQRLPTNTTPPVEQIKVASQLKKDVRLYIKLLIEEFEARTNTTQTYKDLLGSEDLISFYRLFTLTLRGNLPPQLSAFFSINDLLRSPDLTSCVNSDGSLRLDSLLLSSSCSKPLTTLKEKCAALAKSMQRSGAQSSYIAASISNAEPASRTVQALSLATIARSKGAARISSAALLAQYLVDADVPQLTGTEFYLSQEALRTLDEVYGNVMPNVDPFLLQRYASTSTPSPNPSSDRPPFPPIPFETWQSLNAVNRSQATIDISTSSSSSILSASLNSTFRGPVSTTFPFPMGQHQLPISFTVNGTGTVIVSLSMDVESISPLSQGLTITKEIQIYDANTDSCIGSPLMSVPVQQTVCVNVLLTAPDATSSVVVIDSFPGGFVPVTPAEDAAPVPMYRRVVNLPACRGPQFEVGGVWWSCSALPSGSTRFAYRAVASLSGKFVLPAAQAKGAGVNGSTGAQSTFVVTKEKCVS